MRSKFLLLLLFLLLLPSTAYAQDGFGEESIEEVVWNELRTENFIIVYGESVTFEGSPVECACGVEVAQSHAAFVDEVYQDLAAVFETELDVPINLRLFPTEESYYQVNPLARSLPGVIAHALNTGDEMAVALPRVTQLSEEQLVNNIRHEMTHLFISKLSDGRMNTGFQEGFAQYLEGPGLGNEQPPTVLQSAYEQDALLDWAMFENARDYYGNSQVSYPQSLSVVAFLVDEYGFPKLLEFAETSSEEPGYRSALEETYGVSADELERAWRDYLPSYFEGRWQVNAIYTYDLDRVRELVDRGAYSDAEADLTEIVTLLETTDQTDTLAEAEALLAKARQGIAAHALGDEAVAALEQGDYATTIEKGQQAIAAYEAIGYRDRIEQMSEYVYRAQRGQEAIAQIEESEQLMASFRYFEADRQLRDATAILQGLDNQEAAQRGSAMLDESAQSKSLIAYVMLAVGIGLLIMNGLRRIFKRLSANPLDLEFS